MEKGKKMTIDDLARIMASSFGHLEKKMDERFEQVNKRIDKLEKKVDDGFEEVDTRFSKLENGHERRITLLEDDVRIIKTTLSNK